MANKWASRLQKMEGAVTLDYNPHSNVIRTSSPSLNWSFGNIGHGLPFGYTMLLGGPAKAGKSLIAYNIIAELHKNDPEAIAVIFNTEFRANLQANSESLAKLGIDKERIIIFETNTPDGVFDRISKDIAALCQDGAPIKLIAVDSISQIQGRRRLNADSVNQQLIGDQAITIQDGLSTILPTIRKYKIATILLTHVRDEMDMAEQMRGNKFKLQGANALKHFCEWFAMVEPNKAKAGRTTLDGEALTDENSTDMMGKADLTGHKIRFKIIGSSAGGAGRTGEFTLDYEKGIINQHEEVFTLGLNTGVILKPNNVTYEFEGRKWRGLADCLGAIKEEPDLQKQILTKVYEKDI